MGPALRAVTPTGSLKGLYWAWRQGRLIPLRWLGSFLPSRQRTLVLRT